MVMADADIFEQERPRLIGVAYRLVGTPDNAEDVVQEAWLRWSGADHDTPIDNPAGWLTTVVTRLALDRLRSAQHRRERYVGPFLSEPWFDALPAVDDPADSLLLQESVSLGFLAVLERLSPLERAVFILHKVFDTPLAEVAEVVERSPAATRQLSKRAADHVAAGRPRFATDEAELERLTAVVMEAAFTGDLDRLESHLAEDVVHLSDGGANHRAARAPIVGPTRVARFFIGIARSTKPGMEFHHVRANGQLAMYTTLDGEPFLLLVSNVTDGRVAASYAVRNPDKLAAFHRAWLASG
jgi:RNA polymerase sigma-70 factor (ECF subfamily)